MRRRRHAAIEFFEMPSSYVYSLMVAVPTAVGGTVRAIVGFRVGDPTNAKPSGKVLVVYTQPQEHPRPLPPWRRLCASGLLQLLPNHHHRERKQIGIGRVPPLLLFARRLSTRGVVVAVK